MRDRWIDFVVMLSVILCAVHGPAAEQAGSGPLFEDYIRAQVASAREMDVFLNEMSWA
jgi:hypothetical protein